MVDEVAESIGGEKVSEEEGGVVVVKEDEE